MPLIPTAISPQITTLTSHALPLKPAAEPSAAPVAAASPSTRVSLGAVEHAPVVYNKPPKEVAYLRYQQNLGVTAATLSQQLITEWSSLRNNTNALFRPGLFLGQVGALSAETSSFRNEVRNFSVPADIAAEKFSPDFSALVGKRKESFLLTVRTKDGDEVTIRMERRQGKAGESLEFAFHVTGELSEKEQRALDKLASKLGEVADEFFRTGTAELRGLAAFDEASIQSFSFKLSKPNDDDYDTLSYDYALDDATQTRRLSGEDVAGYQFDITTHLNGVLKPDTVAGTRMIAQYLDLIREAGNARDAESASIRFMIDGLRSALLLDSALTATPEQREKTIFDEFNSGLPDFTASFRSLTSYNPEDRTQVSSMNLSMGQTTRMESDGPRLLMRQESFYELHNSYFKAPHWLEAADFTNGNYVYVTEHRSDKTVRILDTTAGTVSNVLVEREQEQSLVERYFRNFEEIDRREESHRDYQLEDLVAQLTGNETDTVRQHNILAMIKDSRLNLFG